MRKKDENVKTDVSPHFTLMPRKGGEKPLFFQPKLTIGSADDVYEREADAVADKVMRMEDDEEIQTKLAPVDIQRKCAECEEEEKENKKVQRKETEILTSETTAPDIVQQALDTGGTPMDEGTRAFMESRFGYDFSHVKVHTDAVAAKSAQSIQALAYTNGNNIVFNQGQYAPGTDNGKRLLAHELTHVVQQQTGKVSKKVQRAFSSTISINHRYLKSRNFSVSGGTVSVTISATWDRGPAHCSGTEFQVTLRKDDLVFDDDLGTRNFPVGSRHTETWSDLSSGTYYLEISRNDPEIGHCILQGSIDVT